MAARARSVELPFRMTLLGSILMPPGLGAAESFHRKFGLGADDVDRLGFRIAFRFDAQVDGMWKVSRGCLILPTTRKP